MASLSTGMLLLVLTSNHVERRLHDKSRDRQYDFRYENCQMKLRGRV